MPASVWSGRLAFGMVSIPVRLYKAARRERIRFQRVYKPADAPTSEPEPETEPEAVVQKGVVREFPKAATPVPSLSAPEPVARVRNLSVGELQEEPVSPPEILKGYQIEKDRYVTFAPQEVAALRPQTSSELSIAEFVRLQEIDSIFFDTSYYVAPDRGGEKAYALFYRALAETEYAAIGSLAMHGREHATAIRAGQRGLILHTLFYANEVRSVDEHRTEAGLVTDKELELAKLFVRTLAAGFDPASLKDTFEERLQELIRTRSDTAISAYKHGELANRAPVIDIMEALRKSLELARKPVKSEDAAGKAPKARRRGKN